MCNEKEKVNGIKATYEEKKTFELVTLEDSKIFNYKDKNGNFLSDEWFLSAGAFHNGIARVQRMDGKWNFIDEEGNFLSKEDFFEATEFFLGSASVKTKEGSDWYFIDRQELLSKELSEETFPYDWHEQKVVKTARGKTLIVDWVGEENEGFRRVDKDNRCNFADIYGNLLLSEWMHNICVFHDGYAAVQRKDLKWNYVNAKGSLVSKDWFADVDIRGFIEGFACVNRCVSQWNFIDTKGNMLSQQDFSYVESFCNGFAQVQREDKKWNFIDTDGKILSNEWFCSVGCFFGGSATVMREDGKKYNLNTNGEICEPEYKTEENIGSDSSHKSQDFTRQDLVNHPKHYTSHPSGIECIEITKYYTFCIGNAIKYLWRHGLKKEEGKTGKEKAIEDLKKAMWYIQKEIENLGGE